MGRFIFALMLSAIVSGTYAQTDWHLKRDDNGIKVFTATTANSDFKSIRVECTVNATISQLVAFLLDINKQKSWVYNSKSTRLLQKIAPNEYVFYSEISLPWPCANRDYIAHFVINQVTPQLLTIDSHAEPDVLPPTSGIVRVKHSVAHWEVTTIAPAVQKIVYTVQFDPAGSLPAWLTNMFATRGPYETFENLRKGVADPAYRNAALAFIKEAVPAPAAH